jgi:hypothetical protein
VRFVVIVEHAAEHDRCFRLLVVEAVVGGQEGHDRSRVFAGVEERTCEARVVVHVAEIGGRRRESSDIGHIPSLGGSRAAEGRHNAPVLRDLALIGLFDRPTDADDLVGERERAGERYVAPYPARLVVDYGDGARRHMSARLVNVSEGGAALRLYGHAEPGDLARLVIDVGRIPIDVTVRVAWTRHLPGGRMVGVAFETLTEVEHEAIAQLLAEHANTR